MNDLNFLRKISNINSNIDSKKLHNNSNGKLPLENKVSDFKEVFKDKLQNQVVFSKHANSRIEERDINVSDKMTIKLNEGVIQAKEKGIKNALIVVDTTAFIVNTSNNKVVTVVNNNKINENIFTNIDGAIFK